MRFKTFICKGMPILLRQTLVFFEENVVNINLDKFLLSGLQKWKVDVGESVNFRNHIIG